MDNGNKLNKIEEAYQVLQHLNATKDEAAEVFAWRFVGPTKHIALARIESVRKQRDDFCIVPAEGQDRLLQDLLSAQNYLDLYIPSRALLFRCRIKETQAPFRYYLELPEFVAQAERRQNLRLNVYHSEELKVSFGKSITLPRPMSQCFMKSCFDVSTGGLSFLISKTESKLFQPDDIISTVELKSSDWSTKVSAKVLSIRETEPDEGNGFPYRVWRVSCQITQIDAVAKKKLERFIFDRIKEELHAING